MSPTFSEMFTHITADQDGLRILPSTVTALEFREQTRGSLHRLQGLMESANCALSGFFSFEAPYRPWGVSFELPWVAEKDRPAEELATVVQRDIPAIALELASTRHQVPSDVESALTYFTPPLCATPKHTVQGLFVEILLAIDRCLGCMLAEDMHEAMRWSGIAYENLIEAVCQVWDLFGHPVAAGKIQVGRIIAH